MPAGVPGFILYGGGAVRFLQTPKEVTMIFDGDMQVRHVYMDVPHSANVKPSWYGESVGHYEGDTLVVDTVGQNTKTVVDAYRTPHSDKLHVVERWRMVDNGNSASRFAPREISCSSIMAFRSPRRRISESTKREPAARRPLAPKVAGTALLRRPEERRRGAHPHAGKTRTLRIGRRAT
jgi:hypothetical protein